MQRIVRKSGTTCAVPIRSRFRGLPYTGMTTVLKKVSAPSWPKVLVRAAVEGFPYRIIRCWKALRPATFSGFTGAAAACWV